MSSRKKRNRVKQGPKAKQNAAKSRPIKKGTLELTPETTDQLEDALPIDSIDAPYDRHLLGRTLTQWQFGDWASLCKLDPDSLKHHPDRARLALLAAAGQLQHGSVNSAKKLTNLAREWGCDAKLVARILIAGGYNSLAKAEALQGDQKKSTQLFGNVFTAALPGSDTALLTTARMNHQLNDLGIGANPSGELQQLQTNIKLGSALSKPNQPSAPRLKPSSASVHFYEKLEVEAATGNETPFLLLDSKSIPRAGLHYLKTRLSQVLGDQFSFCEWYQEPGCCRSYPCALTGYADHAQKTGEFRLRLVKSHDFELTDPILKPTNNIRQLVLYRDPLFVLTSWFVLDQLNRHSDVLAQQGISMQKIWLAHEKEVVNSAYSIIETAFNPPAEAELIQWLAEKSHYIRGSCKTLSLIHCG